MPPGPATSDQAELLRVPALGQRRRCRHAWTTMIGTVSFELFGHYHNVISDYDG